MALTSLLPTHRVQREDEPVVKTKTEKEYEPDSELQYRSIDLCRARGRLPNK